MKVVSILIMLAVSHLAWAAPKTETFELATYEVPAGWQRSEQNGAVVFMRVDEAAGAAGMITIAKTLTASGDARATFDAVWKTVVIVPDVPAPTVGKVSKRDGWDVIRGSAAFTYEGRPATTTVVSAVRGTSNVVVVLTLIDGAFQKQGNAFLASVRYAAPAATEPAKPSVSVDGAWGFSTGGKMGPGDYAAWLSDRREYSFDGKGGYTFLRRHNVDREPDCSIIRERGTYTLAGDVLALTPTKVEREIWGKVTSGANAGAYTKLVRREKVTAEKRSFRVSYELYPNTNVQNLMLTPAAATERDGSMNATTSYRLFRPDGSYYTAIPPTP